MKISTSKARKKIEEDARKQDLLCSSIGRIIIVKIAVPLKAVYRFSASLIKIPMSFFPYIEKLS
jgi:hypothetical protein